MQLEKILENICRYDKRYDYQCLGIDLDGTQTCIVIRLLKLAGKEQEFEANINIFPNRNSLHITVPLYHTGLIGEDVGAFYQLMDELNASIDGNAKLAVCFWDDSNRPAIILSQDSTQVFDNSLNKTLDYLVDVYLTVRPILDIAITSLNLEFDAKARLKSGKHSDLINNLVKLIE